MDRPTGLFGCWLWQGFVCAAGYGMTNANATVKTTYAHRLSYEALVGPIPAGLELDHLCHNDDLTCAGGDRCGHRRCVNPSHLEPVEHTVNVRRGRVSHRVAVAA